ncbi:MAG: Lrp/AsnC ligand binding domain-containing protein [Chloroflexi bacterium]|nr:Lrp/AsnC ligand binding domain-containing protein [Chloroflexota bacterium]
MQAIILIDVPAKQSGPVVTWLRGLPGVAEAWAIYGEHDIVTRVQVADDKALDRLVMEDIQKHPQVRATRTYLVIESL